MDNPIVEQFPHLNIGDTFTFKGEKLQVCHLSKSKNGFWYGYLEAGDKSTAVLRDPELDTGNKKTVFLFNLARKQILEYTLAIVEPKLRGLKTSEQALIAFMTISTASADASTPQLHDHRCASNRMR